MKYTIHGYSQKVAIELNVDDRDLMILRWFIDYKDNPKSKMKTQIIDNEKYYWINYEGITEAFPIASWKTDTVYRRLKKMADRKILKHKTVKQAGIWSYYTIGENYFPLLDTENEIVPYGEKSNIKDDTKEDPEVGNKSEGIGNKSEGIGNKSEGNGNKSRTKYSSNNNSSNNNSIYLSNIKNNTRKTYCNLEDPEVIERKMDQLKEYIIGDYEEREYKKFLNAGYGDIELIKDVYDKVMQRASDETKKPIKNIINYLANAIRKEFKNSY